MSWLFVGPIPLSGIGQVLSKYAKLMKGDYITFEDLPVKKYDYTFAFIIPQPETFRHIIKKFNPDFIMTVCETEPVHENYRLIFEAGKNVLVPSQFCKDVFERQFPDLVKPEVFPHWPGEVKDTTLVHSPPVSRPYTFYTIGNAADPRKNVKMIIEAFLQCDFGNKARLVIKATCRDPIELKIPNVLFINGLLSDEHIEKIHKSCDCYINCSSSEGVGMGAVEAAVRNKPVIITDYGGLKEYVKTPFVVSTTEDTVGVYDFLYEPHMKWGKPSFEDLVKHMKHCFEQNIREWDHAHTKEFTSGSMLSAKLSKLGSFAFAGGSVEVTSLANDDSHRGCSDDWIVV
jgi:glycosyltransferase involved in cell wall biosynthesis